MPLSAGTRLGPYEILAPLGAGGMGEVYRAHDHHLGRQVAIKTLPDAVATDRERRARFEREARALATLAHPAIATLHEIGEAEGRPFLVMELVEGQTLAERLADGPMPLLGALAIATQLADGLAAAHARGIVHRDLKPTNLALTADGRLKILDFGLAKTGEGTRASGANYSRSGPAAVAGLTSSGMRMGTAGYMSPEQVCGETVDGRADVWAFGCIVFEMLTDARIFPGSSTWEVLAAVLRDEPDWSRLPREVPPEVDMLLHRCLEKDPAKRPADMEEARSALRGPAGAATSLTARPSRLRWRASGRAAAFALGGLAIMAAALGIAWWRNQSTVPGPQPSLAVLPFRDLGIGAKGGPWLGEGLTAAVTAELADSDGIRVYPARNTLEAWEKSADPMKVAKLLGADLVLSGSVQSAGGDLRVTFALFEAPAGNRVAEGNIMVVTGSLFAAQDELAGEVLAALDLARPRRPADASGLPRADQQDRYIKALGLLQRYDRSASVDAAIALLEGLSKEAPESPLVHAALGSAFLHRLSQTRDTSWAPLARSYCERARQLAPHRPEVEVTLAQLAIRTGESAKAVFLLEHVLSVQPGNSDALLALAQALDGAGDPERAEQTYQRLIELEPDYWAAYNRMGAYLFSHGRFREAAGMFRRVTELNPDGARGFSNLGAALQQGGDFEGAMAAFRHSVALETTGTGLANLGTLQFFSGKFDESVRSFEKAATLMPASPEVWFNLGDACRWSTACNTETNEAYRKAIALGSEQLTLNPADRVLRIRLALALAKSGDLAAAEQELRRAQAEDAGSEGLYMAGVVATLAGRKAEAVGLLRRCVAAGYSRALLARDPELNALREEPGFRELLDERRRPVEPGLR